MSNQMCKMLDAQVPNDIFQPRLYVSYGVVSTISFLLVKILVLKGYLRI